MKKKYLNNLIMVYISPHEKEVIEKYTSTPYALIERIDSFIEEAKLKRNVIKRVSVTFTIKELDTLISNIAARANQYSTSPEIQETLANLFGKLANKYNDNIINA